MIRAAILPYARVPGGACCIVVAHDGPVVLVREDIPIGHLATVNGRITRIVGPAEVAAVVARVVEIVRARGVEEARIEDPAGAGTEADRGREIVTAFLHGLPVGVVRVVVPGVRGDVAARLRAVMENEGLDVGGETSSPKRDGLVATHPGPSSPPAAASVVDGNSEATRPKIDAQPTPAPPPAQAPKVGRREMGVDPGTHVALVVLERLHEGANGPVESPSKATVARRVDEIADRADEAAEHRTGAVHSPHPTTFARYVAHLYLRIGSDVPLKRPKLITPRNGAAPYWRTTRHVITDEDRSQLIREVAAFAILHDIDGAVIETMGWIARGSVATVHHVRSARVGGIIEGALAAMGALNPGDLTVRTVMSREWRARVRAMYDGGERSDRDGRDAETNGDRRGSGRTQNSGGLRDRGDTRGPEANATGEPLQRSEGALSAVHHVGGAAPEGARQAASLTWPAAVRSLITGLPTDLPPDDREHVLDGAGAALWALAPEPVAVTPEPRGKRARGPAKSNGKAGPSRRALGCVCVGPCVPACPVRIQRSEAKSRRQTGAKRVGADITRETIAAALDACGWKVRGPDGAALRAGFTDETTMRRRMKEFGIVRPKKGAGRPVTVVESTEVDV